MANRSKTLAEKMAEIREKLTTEHIFMHPDGFGVPASPAQRAACRIIDGQPLGDLRAHPDVLALVGGAEVVERLPSERGVQPTEVVFLAAIRTAKTIIACCAALRATQTVDVSRLGPGEVPRVSLVSLKLDTSAVAHRLLLETVKSSKVLKRLLVSESAEAIVLRHPSGRPIEIACVAGAKAGSGLVARWSAGVIFDEAPRMSGSADAVVNLDDARTAILGRLLPGAQCLMIGSPWAPTGPVYVLVNDHWQKPTEHMVVLRGTGPTLNPTWWTPERCEKLLAQNPTAHRTDVEGEFADPEAGLLSPHAIIRATRESPLELPPDNEGKFFAAMDPSEGAVGGNAWSLAIVEKLDLPPELMRLPPQVRALASRRDRVEPRYRVALTREWRGVSPAATIQEIAALCRRYGLTTVRSDQYSGAALGDLARQFGLSVRVEKTTAASKLEDWTTFALLMHTDRIELSADPVLRRDLLSVKKRLTQNGATIVLPRSGDGRHCDSAAAVCAAIAAANTPVFEYRPIKVPGM